MLFVRIVRCPFTRWMIHIHKIKTASSHIFKPSYLLFWWSDLHKIFRICFWDHFSGFENVSSTDALCEKHSSEAQRLDPHPQCHLHWQPRGHWIQACRPYFGAKYSSLNKCALIQKKPREYWQKYTIKTKSFQLSPLSGKSVGVKWSKKQTYWEFRRKTFSASPHSAELV